MPEEKQSPGSVNFSDINNSEIHTGDISIRQAAGGDIVGRDKLTIGQQIINLVTGTSDQQHDLRNRQVMFKAVRKFWIEGVLEQSLHGAALIELGIEEKKEAVTDPWDTVLQRPNQPNRLFPVGTKIIDVFDNAGRSLLILGEPGSGKTTMLLELARQTIDRAEKDLSQPIPVVFNLSSWTEERHNLDEWLVEELNIRYHLPARLAHEWVKSDSLLLLLDGLDEVARKDRDACVEAINTFHLKSLMPLVICSRVADYERVPVKLGLDQAVVLQQLTKEQIKTYLDQFEADLSTLQKALEQDANLQELAQSPLMLNIMTLVYQGMTTESLLHLDSVEAQRRYLFDTYVKAMFNRRSAKSPYSLKQTIFWLTWLAHNMHRHNQLIFSPDTIDSSWLQTWPQKVIFAFFILFAILPILLALNLLVKFSIPVEILIWFSEEAKKGLLGLGVNTLLGGLIGGLISTLLVVVGHLLFRTQSLVSRLILAYQGYIPWNFPHFLDYATERILLRKVGDGYTFIHRLLLEYFASLGQQEGK